MNIGSAGEQGGKHEPFGADGSGYGFSQNSVILFFTLCSSLLVFIYSFVPWFFPSLLS
jgi:hypothetical protein